MKSLTNRIATYIWVLLASGAGMIFVMGVDAPSTTEGGGPVIRAIYVLFLLFFGVSLALSYKSSLSLVIGEKWLFILWLWALVSTAWSTVPGMTLHRSVALLGTLLAGLFVAAHFEPLEQLTIVARCIGLAALGSLFACIYYPDYAVARTGEWTGIFEQKNGLGHMMALGVICFTYMAIAQRRRRILHICFAVLCGAMLVMSKSVTALVVCAAMLMILPFRKWLTLQAHKLLAGVAAILTVAIPISIYVLANLDSILGGLGREATLTGRVPLWSTVIDEISKRPFLGFGYSAFWFSQEGYRVQTMLGWPMVHSHNGYLEVTLALGLVGLALLLIVMARSILLAVRIARLSETSADFWPLYYLLFVMLDNIAETRFLVANSLIWMLVVANSYWLVRKRLEPVMVEDLDAEPGSAYAATGMMDFTPSRS